MLIEKQIPHSYTILCETGHIQVRLDTVIVDDRTNEVKSRHPWRGVVDPGDTARANALCGAYAEKAMALAGEPFGGWAELETQRAAMIAAAKTTETT